MSLFYETVLPFLKTRLEQYLANPANSQNISKTRKWLYRLLRLALRVGQVLLFAYSFRYLLSPSFAFYKPYY